MSELISGKEAKLAWANGENIEAQYKKYESENCWFLITDIDRLSVFDRQDLNFRLKPRTITINGIEVPAPFEPEVGEIYWHIFPVNSDGYKSKVYELTHVSNQMGAWRTEEEIKQVVAALRSVFGKK